MPRSGHLLPAVFACSLALLASATIAQTVRPQPESTETVSTESEAPVEFTEAILNDPENLKVGQTTWEETCRNCHGRSAYPGKAPKLKPRKYTPDFVYDRVTHGFRKMPAWKDVLSQEERMAVSAYVMSNKFSP